jgi:hypothetical protein
VGLALTLVERLALGIAPCQTGDRHRTSQLRKNRVPWDLEKFWIGHANKDITDKYAEQLKEDAEYRRDWVERVGLGFVVPRVPQSNIVLDEERAA